MDYFFMRWVATLPIGTSGITTATGNQYFYLVADTPVKTGYIKDEYPELADMSEEELRDAALGAFGMWQGACSFYDEWLEEMRASWSDRLDELYGE